MAAKLLDINKNQLIAVGQQTSADVPNDKRNILNWHQDWSYFPLLVYSNRWLGGLKHQ
ncbi:hypothetical protein OAE09_05910 [Alphaproteobacteria bacterium]|nr:hypothetical protein [Alphaproteobacteria bacterium]